MSGLGEHPLLKGIHRVKNFATLSDYLKSAESKGIVVIDRTLGPHPFVSLVERRSSLASSSIQSRHESSLGSVDDYSELKSILSTQPSFLMAKLGEIRFLREVYKARNFDTLFEYVKSAEALGVVKVVRNENSHPVVSLVSNYSSVQRLTVPGGLTSIAPQKVFKLELRPKSVSPEPLLTGARYEEQFPKMQWDMPKQETIVGSANSNWEEKFAEFLDSRDSSELQVDSKVDPNQNDTMGPVTKFYTKPFIQSDSLNEKGTFKLNQIESIQITITLLN